MKTPGVSCNILEFCMILKKLKKFLLGSGPVFCPSRYPDNPLGQTFLTVVWYIGGATDDFLLLQIVCDV